MRLEIRGRVRRQEPAEARCTVSRHGTRIDFQEASDAVWSVCFEHDLQELEYLLNVPRTTGTRAARMQAEDVGKKNRGLGGKKIEM